MNELNKIKQLKSYKLAKYPSVKFYEKKANIPKHILRKGAAVAALLALFEAQSCGAPVDSDYTTEFDARQVIESVFSENGIEFENNVDYVLPISKVTVELDGYDTNTHIGYEYGGQALYIHNEKDSIKDDYLLLTGYADDAAEVEKWTKDFISYLKGIGVL
jgi:hypothetical protein